MRDCVCDCVAPPVGVWEGLGGCERVEAWEALWVCEGLGSCVGLGVAAPEPVWVALTVSEPVWVALPVGVRLGVGVASALWLCVDEGLAVSVAV